MIQKSFLSDVALELFSCIRKCSKCTVRHANQVFSSIVNPFKEMKASIIFALKSQDLNKRALERDKKPTKTICVEVLQMQKLRNWMILDKRIFGDYICIFRKKMWRGDPCWLTIIHVI